MWQAIANKIKSRLSLGYFLPLLAAALLSTWYGLFWSVEQFASISNGLSFLDMQPMLKVGSLFEQVRTYDQQATDYYLWWSLFDYAWPFITFTTMLFISAWLIRFLTDKWDRWFNGLVASAYLTVLMDWLENLGFAALVTQLPDESLALAQLTLTLHAAKLMFNLVFNVGFWILLLAVIGSVIWQRIAPGFGAR